MPRFNFFVAESRLDLYPKLDKRVDEMVTNEKFWPELEAYTCELAKAIDYDELIAEDL